MSYHPDREFERRNEALEQRAEREERMDTRTRHTPAPRRITSGRMLYELAGPADPTWGELSDRMRWAWEQASRFLVWAEATERLPEVLRTPQKPETAVARHGTRVAAIEAALRCSEFVMGDGPGGPPADDEVRALAEECLAAAEVGF